jgi:hypothetical protein
MATLVQLLISTGLGLVGFYVARFGFDLDQPVSIIIGVVVFLLCMGCSVVIIDGDMFD